MMVTSAPHRSADLGLALRSLVWTLLLPGFFAGYLPWRYFGVRDAVLDLGDPLHWMSLAMIVAGVGLLGACVREFAHRGRGTLSPADPPRALVVQGPYRHVRNPMYLAVTVIVLGESILAGSRGLLIYWVIWFAVTQLFVLGYEEPRLPEQFGASYEQYTRSVRRWIPRLRPYRPDSGDANHSS